MKNGNTLKEMSDGLHPIRMYRQEIIYLKFMALIVLVSGQMNLKRYRF